jgi:hypothetical protein
MHKNQRFLNGYKTNYYEIDKKINYLTVFSLILLIFFFRFHNNDFSILFENFTISFFIMINGMRFILSPINTYFIKIILSFFLITITHAYFISNISLFNEIKFIRYFAFISIFFSFGFSIFFIKLFRKHLINTTLYVFALGILVYIFFPNLVSIKEDIEEFDTYHYRLKFLFSEPSAIAALCGLLTIYSIEKKKIIILFIVFTTIILSGSLIALIVTLFCFFYSLNFKNLVNIISFVVILFLIIIIFNIYDYWIFQRIIQKYDLLFNSGNVNSSFYDFSINLNDRIKNFVLAMERMHRENFLFIGFGLNQNIYDSLADRIPSLGLGHHILISFGLIGLIIFLFLSIAMCIKFYRTEYTFLIPFVLAAIINSPQGLLLQGLWFTALGLLINLNIKQNKTLKIS